MDFLDIQLYMSSPGKSLLSRGDRSVCSQSTAHATSSCLRSRIDDSFANYITEPIIEHTSPHILAKSKSNTLESVMQSRAEQQILDSKDLIFTKVAPKTKAITKYIPPANPPKIKPVHYNSKQTVMELKIGQSEQDEQRNFTVNLINTKNRQEKTEKSIIQQQLDTMSLELSYSVKQMQLLSSGLTQKEIELDNAMEYEQIILKQNKNHKNSTKYSKYFVHTKELCNK
ncbi:Hypothetical_protein [Hexamita inflata]|uniref:Hypothetical_protein n=1 Tax=Hexamita inflata TaxID=28002 RepID=A0AA86S0U9_9EUKA|nr:Hypothetical protein HINF_LOCUS63745 [Hexamita inflata]